MIPHSKPWITAADTVAVLDCLNSGLIAEGRASVALESTLEKAFSADRAVVVGSGSQALLLSLRSLNIGPGDEVIMPTYVCPEVLGVVEGLGATPVLSDIDADYLASFRDIEQLCTTQTAAIILPFLFGIKMDLSRFRLLNLPLIVDWAQYLPSRADRGRLEELTVLSFEATKLIAAGEGGAVLASNKAAPSVASLKSINGGTHKQNLYPLSDLQASLAMSQFARLDDMIQRRKDIADRYFSQLRSARQMLLPDAIRERSIFFRFPVRLRRHIDIDALIDRFASNGIAIRRPVDTMLHDLRPGARKFPEAEECFHGTISLPLYPAMRDEDVDKVISVSRELLS